jgi:1A family penicillin-binding protein
MADRRVRMRRRHRPGKVAAWLLPLTLALVASIILASTAASYAVVTSALKDIPDANALPVAEATQIYSADNPPLLLARLYLENREVVPLEKMSPDLKHAVIAVEDERFYQHAGFDAVGIARAVVKDVIAGGAVQGASTITLQYVRNTLLKREARQTTLTRKIREIYIAQELEKKYTKDQILTMYLNTVYFGDGAYGVEAAAKDMFGKPAAKLTLAEAAMLAGLPQSPTRLNPSEMNPSGKQNRPRAVERQHWVLHKMLEQQYITKAQFDAAVAQKLTFKSVTGTTQGTYDAPYFVAYVKKVLQDRYDTARVFRGGLKVYTTLDTKAQTMAEKSVRSVLNQPNDPDAALISIDPRNGYVRAMVGGKDYSKNKFNLATQGKRQPGSSFKTFVLVTALEKGIPPNRGIDSASPAVIHWKPNDWVASNSEGTGYGYISIEQAIQNSVNVVFARLIAELGPHEVVMTAHRMGITTWLPDFPSIALGTQNVTPLEMASAYGTLAANGIHYDATTILKIDDPDGKTIYEKKPVGKKALSPAIAYATTKLLQNVVWHGTGTAADIGRPLAGKTGTSQNYRDAWFVGYTPQLVTAVWVGYTPERSMSDVHGIRVFGGTFPAQIFNEFMYQALRSMPQADFASAPDPSYRWDSSWQYPTPQPPKPTP